MQVLDQYSHYFFKPRVCCICNPPSNNFCRVFFSKKSEFHLFSHRNKIEPITRVSSNLEYAFSTLSYQIIRFPLVSAKSVPYHHDNHKIGSRKNGATDWALQTNHWVTKLQQW